MNEIRIPVITHEEATGDLKEAYEYARNSLYLRAMGKVNGTEGALNYRAVFSLRPEYVRWISDTADVLFGPGRISPTIKDMIAVVVSSANRCNHCTAGHAHLLHMRGVEDATLKSLMTNLHGLDLESKTVELLRFAQKMTHAAHEITDDDVGNLRTAGWSDEQILEAVMVAAFFSMNNRVMETLGVKPLNGADWYQQLTAGESLG
ncbi:MAG: peroxidase-related enzyme [Dehalococcoidia bacterium]|nr:peroxidase-related enzyme [Dehalococcoidia bacterium]